MNWRRISLLCLFTAVATSAGAQNFDAFKRGDGTFVDSTYQPFIASAQIITAGAGKNYPFIRFGSSEAANLVFDDLQGGFKTYTYAVVFCNADWKQSEIPVTQYLDGFYENQITTNKPAFSTLQKYTTYTQQWPSLNSPTPRIAGNYMLLVYTNYDPSQPMLARRVYCYSNSLPITVDVHSTTQGANRFSHQEVDFTIATGNLNVIRPYEQIQTVISQNMQPERTITGLQPTFIRNGELIYDYDGINAVPGGNEFRQFDIRSLRINTPSVAKIYRDSTNRVYLLRDRTRASERYSTLQDLNGQYVAFVQDGIRSTTDPDYAYVTFDLAADEAIQGDIYLYGALTDWKLLPQARLKFDPTTNSYYTRLYLKQGVYDYSYVSRASNNSLLNVTEGEHFETENDYLVFAYFRPIGERYDMLFGFTRTNTLNNLRR